MPNRRVTQFRTATTYLPRRKRDTWDYVTMVVAAAGTLLVNVCIVIPAMSTMGTVAPTTDAYLTWVLICMSANLAAIRGTWLVAQQVIRPWIFDREQQNNEIVPPSNDRSRTRA